MEDRKWYSRKEIEEKKNQYVDCIDKYTDYIESFEQKQQADNRNRELSRLINFCDEIIRQMDVLSDELKKKRIITQITYSKGYFRIERDKYYYKKVII